MRINTYLERISGWVVDEVRGKDWFSTFLPERDHERTRNIFKRTAEGIETKGNLNPIVSRDRKERNLRWSNTTLKDEDGITTAVLAVGIDVTNLEKAQKIALRANRLATIGETMAALAHESRNALQRIQSGMELLAEELEDNPAALSDIHRVERAARELQGLHEQVRTYAAPIQLESHECRLPGVWGRAWDSLEAIRRGRDASLEQETGDVLLQLHIDAERFQQVFRNLFENALAACEDPVKIAVVCAETELNGRSAVEIRVRDNGPGLSSEQRENIFEAFFTTKSKGTGLGMSIVQRIIEAHGATIGVAPEATEGAEFVITVPR